MILESACRNMVNFTLGLTTATLVLVIMYLYGMLERIAEKKEAFLNRKKTPGCGKGKCSVHCRVPSKKSRAADAQETQLFDVFQRQCEGGLH